MPAARTWTSERGVLWGIDLQHAPPQIESRVRAQFVEVGPEAALALAQAMSMAEPSVRERMVVGRQCFVARLESEIAAYGWVSRRNEYIGEQERDIKLQADEAYIWDCATLPPYRGQRLYSALLSQMLSALRDNGVRRVWIGTAVSNRASLRAFANAGFQPLIGLTYARLFRLRFLWISDQPDAPRELVAGARRALIDEHERVWGSLGLGWSDGN